MSTKRERRIRLTGGAVSAAFLAIALAGCSGLSHPEDFPADGQGATVTSNPQDVRAEDFGRTWPLSVTSGTISCSANADGDPVLRFTAPDGTQYALNALDDNADLAPISEISDGSVGTLRTFAFAVCDA